MIEAGKEIGLEYREDVNDLPPGQKDCIGWRQHTRGGRRRASAARTYREQQTLRVEWNQVMATVERHQAQEKRKKA